MSQPIAQSLATPSTARLLFPYTFSVFLACFAIGTSIGVLPSFVHENLGFSPVMVGWVMGSQSLATLLSRPFSGSVSDGRGGRTAVLLGCGFGVLTGLAYLAASFPLPATSRLVCIFLGRAMLGWSESLVITGSLAWAIAAVGAPHTGRAIVWVGTAMYAALGLGAPAGAALYGLSGFAAPAGLAIAMPLVAGFIAFALPPVAAPPGLRLPFRNVIGLVWKPGLGLAFSTVSYGAIAAFLVLDYRVKGWGGAAYGIFVFGVAFIVARLCGGHLPDKLGGAPLALYTLPMQIVGQLLLWSAWHPAVALLGTALTGAGYSLTFPALGIEAARATRPQDRGAAMGAYMLFLDVGLGISGPLTGAIVAAFGYPSGFLWGAAAAAIGVGITLQVLARQKAISRNIN